MNLWECSEPGCKRTASGEGGAIGLRAIGWYFVVGEPLFCPRHRPDTRACAMPGENHGKDCSECVAQIEADRLQQVIVGLLPEAYQEMPDMLAQLRNLGASLVHMIPSASDTPTSPATTLCGLIAYDWEAPLARGDRYLQPDQMRQVTCHTCRMAYALGPTAFSSASSPPEGSGQSD